MGGMEAVMAFNTIKKACSVCEIDSKDTEAPLSIECDECLRVFCSRCLEENARAAGVSFSRWVKPGILRVTEFVFAEDKKSLRVRRVQEFCPECFIAAEAKGRGVTASDVKVCETDGA